MRWEYSTPWYDTQNKIVALVPGLQSTQYPNAPTGLVYPGDPGIPKTLAPTRYNNFAPRFGIAYSPNISEGVLGKIFGGPGKTSIRLGSGIFYTAIQDQTLYWILGTVPFGEYWASPAPTLFEEPFRTRSTGESQGQPFPYVIPAPGSAAAKNFDYSPYLPLVSTLGYDTRNKLPYGIHYNFTIQRQLSASMVLSLGYVGTLGRKLLSISEDAQQQDQGGFKDFHGAPSRWAFRRPFPLSGPCRSPPSPSQEGRNGAFSRHQIDSPDPQCMSAQCCRSVTAPKPVMPL